MNVIWVLGALLTAFLVVRALDWYFGRRKARLCVLDDSGEILRSAQDMTDKVDAFMRQVTGAP